MGNRIRPSDEVVQANMKRWNIPQPEQEYTVLIHCTVYNHGQYIEDALKGFVMQKCSYSFCAIIIDDCSTDNAPDIIRGYAEKYPDVIKPILLGENHMQHGIPRDPYFEKWHQSAKYIAFCEGDDYWIDPLKLQKQVDFMESNPEYSMCFHRAEIKNEQNIECALKCSDIENRDYNPNELFAEWKVPSASMLMKKDVLGVRKHNKGTKRILNGDIITVLNSFFVGKVYGMADLMSVYRVQNTGVTYDPKWIHNRAMCYPDHFLFIKDNYPMLNKDLVDRNIGTAYLIRRHEQNSILKYCLDTMKGIWYYPKSLLIKRIYHKFLGYIE